MLWQVFATATLPTDASVAFSRGKGVFWPVFGTATLPTGTSVASPRGEGGIYRLFGTATLPTGTSVPTPRLLIGRFDRCAAECLTARDRLFYSWR